MNDDERLVSRTFPDRRVNEERRVDFDPTVPNRRATDRRAMDNTLILAAFVQSRRQYLDEPERITAMGEFA